MRVLGIDVDGATAERWLRNLAPDPQPFFVSSVSAWPGVAVGRDRLTPALRDTYQAWRIDRALDVVWIDEATFDALDRSRRKALVREQVQHRRGAVPTVRGWRDVVDPETIRAQADGHRFVWWPSLLSDPAAILRRIIEPGLRPSRHAEVDDETWATVRTLLPGVRGLAGTFLADGEESNCFGAVMAAAGACRGADTWIGLDAFTDWLATACTPIRGTHHDDRPGTVLVWHTPAQPFHAAVTIGAGYAFEKPSQEWWTPRTILRAEEIKRANRGLRLERHRLDST